MVLLLVYLLHALPVLLLGIFLIRKSFPELTARNKKDVIIFISLLCTWFVIVDNIVRFFLNL